MSSIPEPSSGRGLRHILYGPDLTPQLSYTGSDEKRSLRFLVRVQHPWAMWQAHIRQCPCRTPLVANLSDSLTLQSCTSCQVELRVCSVRDGSPFQSLWSECDLFCSSSKCFQAIVQAFSLRADISAEAIKEYLSCKWGWRMRLFYIKPTERASQHS